MSIEIIKDLGMHYPKKGSQSRRFRYHLVRCSCGNEFETANAKKIENCLECGNRKAGKKRETHGDNKTRLNRIWRGMKNRCNSTTCPSYPLYGAKGVTVCKEWEESFIVFKKWALDNGYTDNLDLDKDELCEKLGIVPKIYSPKTCMWKTRQENGVTNLRVTPSQEKEIVSKYLKGIKIAQIAEEYDFTWNGIKAILKRNSCYNTAST